ncbi:MAG: Na+/H+ antiporter NhaA [Terriglobales bacterium]
MALPPRTQGSLAASKDASAAVRTFALPVLRFIHTEGSGGMLLVGVTVLALLWANSPWRDLYFSLWHAEIAFDMKILHLAKPLHYWINDGLMAIFFFLVGMEIKHELTLGVLTGWRRAALPAIAALGGMVVPAGIYLAFNLNSGFSHGWGIPMATDIAFALAVLALVKGVPVELKIFLLALAIIDDIGAVVVIAIFYTSQLSFSALALSLLPLALILVLLRVRERSALPYAVCAFLFWFAVLKSGVHATIAGIVLAFLVPHRPWITRAQFVEKSAPLVAGFKNATETGDDDTGDNALGALESLVEQTEAPVERLTRLLHPWVSFFILPLFAFSNAGVPLAAELLRNLASNPISIGLILGLVIGKPIGIFLFTWLAVRLRIAELPPAIRMTHIAGVGMIAGIGFTVSLFIADLAFTDEQAKLVARTGVLVASFIAAIIGYMALRYISRKPAAI